MQLSSAPDKLVLPFAATGGKNAIPVASQIGIVDGAASYADGWPPLTRTPLAAGGVPPFGLDANGILYEISNVVRWSNAGGVYPYDAAFATDANVGGYPKGAIVLKAAGTGYWVCTADNNTTDPDGGTPANWVSFESILSAAGLLTLIKTVDGAGSGLDADLLDGKSSTAFGQVDNAYSIGNYQVGSSAGGTTETLSITFTAPCNGKIMIVAARNNSDVDTIAGAVAGLFLDGVSIMTDKTKLSITHSSVKPVVSGVAYTVSYAAACNVAFSCNLSVIFVPNVGGNV